MSKKQNILRVLESQIDKIVLGVMILISLVLLWVYVLSNPYGQEVSINGRQTRVKPGTIDRLLKADAEQLLAGLEQPPKTLEAPIDDQRLLVSFTEKLQCAVPDIPSELAVPYPGVGEAAIEEDRLYAVPVIPSLTDVEPAALRGAARVPVEEVTPGVPYKSVETKLEDIDFVTVSGHFDVERLFNNFQLSFNSPGLKASWRDPQLARPVFARIELERRRLQADGTYSEWTTVPRARIDAYKKMIEQLPLHADQMQFGVDVWISQFAGEEVQRDILQPDPYEFAISKVEWMPPEYLDETFELMQKQAQQERREAIEELRKSREEEERRNTDRGGRRPTPARRPAGRGGAGDGPIVGREEMYLGDQEMTPRERRLAQRRERTQQDIERDVQNVMIQQISRLESLREPVMVWAHDDTVEPGQTYQYRVRMGVFNPVTGKDWFIDDQAAYQDQTVLWSAYSEPTEDVEIPKMLHVFPMDPLMASRDDGSRSIEGVSVEVAKYYLGQWHSHDFDVYPGQTIGFPVEDTPETDPLINGMIMPEMGMPRGRETVTGEPMLIDYSSGMTLVDIVTETFWGTRMRPSDLHNMLYYEHDTLSEMGIGKTNWSSDLRQAYDDVQTALEETVEQRNLPYGGRPIPGRPGMEGEFRGPQI